MERPLLYGRRMHHSKLILVLAALTSVAGCKKQEAAPAASGSASSEAPVTAKVTVTGSAAASAVVPAGSAAPAAAPSTTCKPGAFIHKNPDFCIELPADFKPGKEDKDGDNSNLAITSSANLSLNVYWSADHQVQSDLDYIHAYKTPMDKTVTSLANGDLPGGAGAYAHYKMASGIEEMQYLYVGKNADIFCLFQAGAPDSFATLEAICKTVKVP
jgi:hypothetical protein